MIQEAVARPLRAQFIQYSGGNPEEARGFAGDEYLGITTDGVILIQFFDTRHTQPLYPGWYLVRYAGDANVRVFSFRSFEATFEALAGE